MRLLLLALLMTSCGKQEFDDIQVNANDSEHKISGETKTRIIVELQFIGQVKGLCRDLNLKSDFETIELYKQEVAACTFEKISVLNLGEMNSSGLDSVLDDICSEEEYQSEPICQ